MPDTTEPTIDTFLSALRAVELTELQERMLVTHYEAPERTITAEQFARALGFDVIITVNSNYGKLGRKLGATMQWQPDSDLPVAYLTSFEKPDRNWLWTLRPELAAALEVEGVVNPSLATLAEEVDDSDTHFEGAVKTVTINSYERSREARIACLAEYGFKCRVCGIQLSEVYGDVAKNFIHVHHLLPISEIGENYEVEPLRDLCPICPNCHAIVHRRSPPYTIDEVKSMLESTHVANKHMGSDG